MIEYEDMPGFEHFVLEESFVLDVAAKPGSVKFRLEVVLTPDHPKYVAPGPDSYLCYRDGRLEFDGVTELEWTGQGAPPATDASGETDYGHIDTMTWDSGLYELTGDWGQMKIWAASAQVVLDE
ncbi:hypothetical protein [Kribbella sp. CA-247076]|uniref:hypothetical protein n=1 Tax=Kribbella sp. CA-247076 TaxID=3239941 RepID=UPI003D92BE01